jgi:hypothetical protein
MVVQTIDMNIKSLIFDTSEEKTINGLPAGYLNESYPHILPPDAKPGQPPPIDVQKIIEAFHPTTGDTVSCVHSGLPSDGISAVDGNPSNFLITNLEPVNRTFINSLPPLPKGVTTRTFTKCGEDSSLFIEGKAYDFAVLPFRQLPFRLLPFRLLPFRRLLRFPALLHPSLRQVPGSVPALPERRE